MASHSKKATFVGNENYVQLVGRYRAVSAYRAQYAALKKVNKEHIALCWYIGETIVEKQQAHNWGKAIFENLSHDLQKEFPGVQGFSTDSLWRMRKFYLRYKDNKKLAPLVQEISWSKNIIIMEKCNDNLEREFYIKMTKQIIANRRKNRLIQV